MALVYYSRQVTVQVRRYSVTRCCLQVIVSMLLIRNKVKEFMLIVSTANCTIEQYRV